MRGALKKLGAPLFLLALMATFDYESSLNAYLAERSEDGLSAARRGMLTQQFNEGLTDFQNFVKTGAGGLGLAPSRIAENPDGTGNYLLTFNPGDSWYSAMLERGIARPNAAGQIILPSNQLAAALPGFGIGEADEMTVYGPVIASVFLGGVVGVAAGAGGAAGAAEVAAAPAFEGGALAAYEIPAGYGAELGAAYGEVTAAQWGAAMGVAPAAPAAAAAATALYEIPAGYGAELGAAYGEVTAAQWGAAMGVAPAAPAVSLASAAKAATAIAKAAAPVASAAGTVKTLATLTGGKPGNLSPVSGGGGLAKTLAPTSPAAGAGAGKTAPAAAQSSGLSAGMLATAIAVGLGSVYFIFRQRGRA